jgi:hypothetical protein
VKNFARVFCSIAAQTGKSASAGNNPDKAAADSYCAAGFDGGNLKCGSGRRPGPHLQDIQAMFDCENPGRSGNLAGESFAATLENHPRYPALRSGRHRALLERCADIVAHHVDSITGILHGLGFNDAGIVIYRSAALSAFRAARPNI